MYVPDHFAEHRADELHRLVRAHPLGILVTAGANGLDANHLPFELDLSSGVAVLRAHVARANPLWRDVPGGSNVMVVFRGEESYVSPNWYPSKHEQHRQVPTWNYVVVHAHGRLTIRDDERYVRGLVARLTRSHEASEPVPWKMSDSSASYIDQMLSAIVGIEIDVDRFVGKSKLSQNKDARDRRGAADALADRGGGTLAEAMRQAPPALDP